MTGHPAETEASVAGTLIELAAELAAEESVVSPLVRPHHGAPALGALAAAGPRAAAAPAAYARVVEFVREGYLLHYGEPRLLADPDPELALLAGDYLYAKGLERLAALGDLEAVRELGDLISLSAQLHAEGPASTSAVGAAWLASAVAIGAGGGDRHELAKRALRTDGDPEPLYETAAATAARAGLGERLTEAADAVGFSPSHLG
jgi:hypothetical protein